MGRLTLAGEFAEWIDKLTFEELPSDVVDEAKASVRDFIGNAVSGAAQPWMQIYRRLAAENFASGDSTVALTPSGVSVRDAAFLNAIYCHAYEYDDSMSGHPSSVVVSTALSLGEHGHISGRDLLTAIVVGYEIMYRSTAAIHPSEVRRGFNGTGLAGPYGSAAVSGKLLGLSSAKLMNALAIAGNYSCGLMEYDVAGGESKRLYSGIAARAGLEAAQLADLGLTGPPSVFEGKKGVFNTFGLTVDLSKSQRDLGSKFHILRRWCKAYPCMGTAHGAIDCMEALCAKGGLDVSEIGKITVAVPRVTLVHGGAITVPWDLVSAQFSLKFSVALRAIYRSNDIKLYADSANWHDPRVVALIEKIEIVEATSVPDGADAEVSMVIELIDGSSVSHVQPAPKGSAENPLTRDESISKYRDSIGRLLSAADISSIENTISVLERVNDIGHMVRLIRGGRP